MVTLKQIATAAGVSISTASNVLRGSTHVSAATRERVTQVAAQLGYQSDPSARALRALRHDGAGEKNVAIAMLGLPVSSHILGFQESCSLYGYDPVIFELTTDISPEQITQRLSDRGVIGVLLLNSLHGLCSKIGYSHDDLLRIDWSRFSVVKLTRLLPFLSFHRVQHSAFDYAQNALKNIFANGATRVAAILSESGVSDDDSARLAAILNWAEVRLRPGEALQWKTFQYLDPADSQIPLCIGEWLKDFRPNVVLTFPFGWYTALQAAGFRIPDDFIVSSIIAPKPSSGIQMAGNETKMEQMIFHAVQLLHRLIVSGEKGMTLNPSEVVVFPRWLNVPYSITA